MENSIFLATTRPGIARAEREAAGSWQVTSLLEDQDVRCLAADPLDPAVVYAGTQGNGVLRSTDRGRSWQTAGLAGQIVKSLAVSPHEPGVLYAGTKPTRVYVSRERGGSWRELEGFRRIRRWWWLSPAEPPFTAYVQAISISPTDPRAIVCGIEFGAVVRSTDGGETWSHHRKGAVRDCHSMTFHARDGNYVYEAGGGGAAISRDGGESWLKPKEGLDRRYGWACAADPEQPEVWYVSASPMRAGGFSFAPAAHVDGKANAAIFRSEGGAPWQRLRGGLPQPLNYMAYALLTDPAAPGHLYAGLSDGNVWHSTDHGESWQQLPFNLEAVQMVMIRL